MKQHSLLQQQQQQQVGAEAPLSSLLFPLINVSATPASGTRKEADRADDAAAAGAASVESHTADAHLAE